MSAQKRFTVTTEGNNIIADLTAKEVALVVRGAEGAKLTVSPPHDNDNAVYTVYNTVDLVVIRRAHYGVTRTIASVTDFKTLAKVISEKIVNVVED